MIMSFDFTEFGVRLLAVYVAQLTKEGVTFKINQMPSGVTVELTGGF